MSPVHLSPLRILLAHNRYQQRGGEDAMAEVEVPLLERGGHQLAWFKRKNNDIRGMNRLHQALGTLWSPESAHGPCHEQNLLTQMRELPPSVRFDTGLLPESVLPGLLASADIGLALYREGVLNDRLTAYLWQKAAMYLPARLPFIAFPSDTYTDLFSRFWCGECIKTLYELIPAAQRIQNNYSAYSLAAFAAFDAIYRLEAYWSPLSRFPGNCVSAGHVPQSDRSFSESAAT